MKIEHKPLSESKLESLGGIPKQSTQAYIGDMIREMQGIADGADLDEVSNILKLTLTAIETNGRLGLLL